MASNSDLADSEDDCQIHHIRLSDGVCWRCREADMLSRPQPQTPERPATVAEDDELPVAAPPSRAELAKVEKLKREFRKKKATKRRRPKGPPPTLGPPPPKLICAAALGPGLFWLVEDGPSDALAQHLRADGLEDLQDLLDPVILEHSKILLANAFLVANTNPGPSDWLDNELRALRDLAQNHPRSSLGLGNVYTELQRRVAAVAALQDQNWEWNDRERRAKRPRAKGVKQGPPDGLFTHIAMRLYDSWHVEGGARVPAKLVARIALVLGWFFEAELTGQAEWRIRNVLRKRERTES